MAFPSGRLVPLVFDTTLRDGPRDITLNFKILPDLCIAPLLITSRFFNSQVHREYNKIEIPKLSRGSKTQIFKALPNHQRPWNMFPHQSRRNNFGAKKSASRYLAHVYLQPKIDTLVIDYQELFKLYLAGGSINLSRVTHLALLNSRNCEFSYSLWLEYNEIDVGHLMYAMLSDQCPALEKLSLVVGRKQDIGNMHINSEDMIFDITDEFCYFEWENKRGAPQHVHKLGKLLNTARRIISDFKRFPQHGNPQHEVSASTLQFWATREPVPALTARLDRDKSWREDGKICAEPRLYFPGVHAYLPAHQDGTILDKYKGIAQIFDGAPW
ncbi:hypothetical protein DSL72_006865 [Monilinia vaccinii-corymbosi]|uniref:Uncharacterized protein n=1 Tax=Monilinia vaccinii-corymbosi TaxID=61207 RepID=A0A8A3PL53_9HELO|nr:hypothetical protein DSL72_006865 [Monilinia vaccinii-corymbosi]